MMQTSQVPPALEALMQMGARPTAPGPRGQQVPTVAANIATQATPPSGIQAVMPGVQQQAMKMAQEQQPVMMGELPPQLQQAVQQSRMPGTMMASGGVAQLPAPNMKFANGGVVGYNGQDGSIVDPELEALRERIKRQFASQASPLNILDPKADQERQRAQDIIRMLPRLDKTQMRNILGQTSRVADPNTWQELGPGESNIAAPGVARSAAPPMSASPAQPVLDRPSVAAAGTQYPQQTAERLKRMQDIERQRGELQKSMPDLNAEGIAALEAANRARQEMLTKQRGDDKFNRRMALYKEMGGQDTSAWNREVANQQARDQNANYADLLHKQAVLKLREAQQAKQLGQFDRALAFEKEAAELENKANDFELRAKQIASQMATSEYSGLVSLRNQDIQVREGELNRAQNERFERIRRATANQPGEAERIFNEYTRRKAIDPKDAEDYLATIDRIKGSGRGNDLRETSVELRALKDEEQQLLKRLETTFSSQERAPINARLEQISRDRVKLMGGTPTSAEPPRLPPQAVSQLKEGVVTKFANGQQWTLKNGQPTQVK